MDLTYTYILNQTGETIKITDTTDWGVSPNPDRVDYALLCAVVKFVRNGVDTTLIPSSGTSTLVYSAGFDNTERTEFEFDLGNDGYHYIRVLPIILDDSSSVTDGDVYLDTADDTIYLRESGAWVAKTYTEIALSDSLNEAFDTDIGVNPKFEKILDILWRKYEADSFPREGEDYKNFQIGYAILVGASSTLKQGEYVEYDRQIAQATNLSKTW